MGVILSVSSACSRCWCCCGVRLCSHHRHFRYDTNHDLAGQSVTDGPNINGVNGTPLVKPSFQLETDAETQAVNLRMASIRRINPTYANTPSPSFHGGEQRLSFLYSFFISLLSVCVGRPLHSAPAQLKGLEGHVRDRVPVKPCGH